MRYVPEEADNRLDGKRYVGQSGAACHTRECLGDLGQPLFELRRQAGIEPKHRSDHPGNALRNLQLEVANDEERRAKKETGAQVNQEDVQVSVA